MNAHAIDEAKLNTFFTRAVVLHGVFGGNAGFSQFRRATEMPFNLNF